MNIVSFLSYYSALWFVETVVLGYGTLLVSLSKAGNNHLLIPCHLMQLAEIIQLLNFVGDHNDDKYDAQCSLSLPFRLRIFLPSVIWHCLLVIRNSIRPVKNLDPAIPKTLHKKVSVECCLSYVAVEKYDWLNKSRMNMCIEDIFTLHFLDGDDQASGRASSHNKLCCCCCSPERFVFRTHPNQVMWLSKEFALCNDCFNAFAQLLLDTWKNSCSFMCQGPAVAQWLIKC